MNPENQARTFVILLLVVLTACSPATTPVPTEPPPPTTLQATATPAQPVTRTAKDLKTELDTIMQKMAKSGNFSGSILVARNGEIIMSEGYGQADREKKILNTAQTRYRIGSITKQFTAMAILMLQELGKLNVQDPICNYMTDCPAAWKGVTLHHLLTHTSGIPNFTEFSDYNATKATPSSPEQTIHRFTNKPLDFKPGEKWNYSNSNYVLLGKVIEQASGQSYEDFLRRYIFEPLKMNSTGYDRNQPDLAVGYVDQTVSKADYHDMSIPYAAGALLSTVEDLYRWDQALYTEQLLPQKALDDMFTAHVSVSEEHGLGYGYGWLISRAFNRFMIFHGGSIDGYTSLIERYPDDKVTVIVLTNQGNLDPAMTSDMLKASIFGGR